MTMEEVAQRDPPSSGFSDTNDFWKNLESVYLERQQICLADSNIVSEEHVHGRGGTTGPPV